MFASAITLAYKRPGCHNLRLDLKWKFSWNSAGLLCRPAGNARFDQSFQCFQQLLQDACIGHHCFAYFPHSFSSVNNRRAEQLSFEYFQQILQDVFIGHHTVADMHIIDLFFCSSVHNRFSSNTTFLRTVRGSQRPIYIEGVNYCFSLAFQIQHSMSDWHGPSVN